VFYSSEIQLQQILEQQKQQLLRSLQQQQHRPEYQQQPIVAPAKSTYVKKLALI